MTRHELARSIYQVSRLTGQFKLRSGQTSSEYFDKYRFESQPKILKEIARNMASLVPKNTELLASLEMGGIPIGTALSLETGIPGVFVRKEAKSYGTCLFAEGAEVKGRRLTIIEDVVTTGGQVLLSTQDLRKSGALVEHVLCVIFRGDDKVRQQFTDAKLNLVPLFTKQDLELSIK